MFSTAPSLAAELIVERLRRPDDPAVTWRDGADEVLLHLDSLCVTDAAGWRQCELELESPESGRSHVRFAFHTSVNALGDRVRASAIVSEASSPLLERCAADVEATLWEALLECDGSPS
jgi:hypothetical protein